MWEADNARPRERIEAVRAVLLVRLLDLTDSAEHDLKAVEDDCAPCYPQAGEAVRRRFLRLLQLPCLPSQREHPTRNYRPIRVRADTPALCSLSILCKGVRDRTQREKSLVCSAGRLAYFIASRCGFQGWLSVLSRQARQAFVSLTCWANAGPGVKSVKLPATSDRLGGTVMWEPT